jgi:hypothetical protein
MTVLKGNENLIPILITLVAPVRTTIQRPYYLISRIRNKMFWKTRS